MLEIEISKKQNLCHIIKFQIQEIKFILPIYRTHSTNKCFIYITYKKYRRTINRKRNYFFFLSLFPFLCPIFSSSLLLLISFFLFFYSFLFPFYFFFLFFFFFIVYFIMILWENGAQQFRWIILFIRKQSSSRFFLVVSVSCKWLREDINNNESV